MDWGGRQSGGVENKTPRGDEKVGEAEYCSFRKSLIRKSKVRSNIH